MASSCQTTELRGKISRCWHWLAFRLDCYAPLYPRWLRHGNSLLMLELLNVLACLSPEEACILTTLPCGGLTSVIVPFILDNLFIEIKGLFFCKLRCPASFYVTAPQAGVTTRPKTEWCPTWDHWMVSYLRPLNGDLPETPVAVLSRMSLVSISSTCHSGLLSFFFFFLGSSGGLSRDSSSDLRMSVIQWWKQRDPRVGNDWQEWLIDMV